MAGPSKAPRNVQVKNIKESDATLSWKPIPCGHQNGKILHYLILYDFTLPSGSLIQGRVETAGDIQEFLLHNLHPNTKYSVKVAGVNVVGIGNFFIVSQVLEP